MDITYNNYNLNWWGPKTFFKGKAVLIPYGKKLTRKQLKIPSEITVIGDSGGYEILTRRAKGQKVDINPFSVLRWEEENCDIGITLDMNPINLKAVGKGKSLAMHHEPTNQRLFEERLEESCRNNQIFQDNRQNPNLKIYNVVHSGLGKAQWIEKWYERVKDFKFEGWSIAPKSPGDPIKVAADGMFLYDRGIRENMHVLGISGIYVLPVLVYMEQFIKNISTDSFSYGVNAIVRTFQGFHLGPSLTFSPKDRKHSKVPCLCPVCSKITVEDLYRTDVPGYSLIALHNLWTYFNLLQYLEALVEDPERWNRYIKKRPNLRIAIDFIDNVVSDGWETALGKLGVVSQSLEGW